MMSCSQTGDQELSNSTNKADFENSNIINNQDSHTSNSATGSTMSPDMSHGGFIPPPNGVQKNVLEQVYGVSDLSDVRPYELMKLRLLNGAHSALAYISLLVGHKTVDVAMADPQIRQFVRGYMQEMLPSVPEVPGVDLKSYCEILVDRFSNPAISDQLSRLALDGSTKFSFFVSDGTLQLIHNHLPIKHIAFALAAWVKYMTGKGDKDSDRFTVQDSRFDQLHSLAERAVESKSCESFLRAVLPSLCEPPFVTVMDAWLAQIVDYGSVRALQDVLK